MDNALFYYYYIIQLENLLFIIKLFLLFLVCILIESQDKIKMKL